MKVYEIIEEMEKIAPPSYAMDWDNPGLLVGRKDSEVKGVYLALDATERVLQTAIQKGDSMLITHHPMIFTPVKQVRDDDFIGSRILCLAEHHMSYYAMHTNFDVAVMGEIAADRLGLKGRQVLQVTLPADALTGVKEKGIGCAGLLPKTMTLRECGEYVKKVFEIPTVKIFGDLDSLISRAAICPGSGKHMASYALALGSEVLITGDIDHHEGIDANSQGLAIIDAGHHGIEHIFTEYMKKRLNELFPRLHVDQDVNDPPFTVI